MSYVVEVTLANGDKVLRGPFPGYEHARRWAEGLKLLPSAEKPEYLIRPISRAD